MKSNWPIERQMINTLKVKSGEIAQVVVFNWPKRRSMFKSKTDSHIENYHFYKNIRNIKQSLYSYKIMATYVNCKQYARTTISLFLAQYDKFN